VRRTATYALIATIATAAGIAAQVPRAAAAADSDAATRGEAIGILQGVDTLPWISEARVALVARALRVIHSQFTQLADIQTEYGGAMLLHIADSAYKSIFVSSGAQRPDHVDFNDLPWHAEVRHTGIQALDRLDVKYGVKRATVWDLGNRAAVGLEFARPVNVPVIRAEYERIPQVSYAMSPWGGSAIGVTLFDKGSKLDFVFSAPSPCFASCRKPGYSYITYDTLSRTATMELQVEHQVARPFPPSVARRPDSIPLWDFPSDLTITPYPKLDSLLAGTHADRWWYRSHAVEVLAELLGPAIGPWQVGGRQSLDQFSALKLEAAARRQEVLDALIDRLNDPDPVVARAALNGLRTRSRRHYGNDAASLTQWHRWVRAVRDEPPPLEIRFINVGKGDAVLVRQGAHAALVDAGPVNDSIVDRLRALGVQSLQLFVTTLDQPDRIGSTAAVRSAFPISTFVDNEHARRRTITFGDTRIEIIPPLSRDSASHINRSAVVRITRGPFSALLTGGVAGAELDSLVTRERLGHVNLLNALQHGDTAAVTTPWLARLAPDVVVVSGADMSVVSGAFRRYEMPKRIMASTLWNGDVAAVVNGDGTYSVQSYTGPVR